MCENTFREALLLELQRLHHSACAPMNPYSLRELGELPPCALRRPPDDPASEKNDGSERKPSVEAGRDDPLAKREHWKNHREEVRSRKSTVRPPATLGIQDASCPHPR